MTTYDELTEGKTAAKFTSDYFSMYGKSMDREMYRMWQRLLQRSAIYFYNCGEDEHSRKFEALSMYFFRAWGSR